MVSGGEENRGGKGKRKGRKIFGEGNYLVSGGEEKQRRKKRKLFGQQVDRMVHVVQVVQMVQVVSLDEKNSLHGLNHHIIDKS